MNAAEKFRGQTALMLAAVENHAAIVQALVTAGAQVNARTAEYTFQNLTGGAGGIIHDRPQGGLTALILAARQGSSEAAERLIAAGADLNATEPQYGFTALQTAIFNGHYALAKQLLREGRRSPTTARSTSSWRCETSRPTAIGRIRPTSSAASVTWTSPGCCSTRAPTRTRRT